MTPYRDRKPPKVNDAARLIREVTAHMRAAPGKAIAFAAGRAQWALLVERKLRDTDESYAVAVIEMAKQGMRCSLAQMQVLPWSPAVVTGAPTPFIPPTPTPRIVHIDMDAQRVFFECKCGYVGEAFGQSCPSCRRRIEESSL